MSYCLLFHRSNPFTISALHLAELWMMFDESEHDSKWILWRRFPSCLCSQSERRSFTVWYKANSYRMNHMLFVLDVSRFTERSKGPNQKINTHVFTYYCAVQLVQLILCITWCFFVYREMECDRTHWIKENKGVKPTFIMYSQHSRSFWLIIWIFTKVLFEGTAEELHSINHPLITSTNLWILNNNGSVK